MSPDEFWFGILTLLAVAVVAPAWMYFSGPAVSDLPIQTQFLIGTLLFVLVGFTLTSWLQPG